MELGEDLKLVLTNHPKFSRAATVGSCSRASVQVAPPEAEKRPPTSICLEEHILYRPHSPTEEKGLHRKLR